LILSGTDASGKISGALSTGKGMLSIGKDRRQGAMNVISLDRARARLNSRVLASRRVEPPAALTAPVRPARDPARSAQAADEKSEDRLRMRQNLAAFLVIVAIVAAGTWLMANLHYYSRLQACLEAGHRNCLPLQTKYLAQPYWR
jgi:hypothetical protein